MCFTAIGSYLQMMPSRRLRYRVSQFVTVDTLHSFREGKIRRYFVNGKEIGVVTLNGRWHAFSNRCTHADFQLHFGFIEDGCLNCPIHYGVFDLETGRAVSGPVTDLPVYAVRVEGNEVQVSIEA
jgi:nitrite reductase/ring-hydroxylating ferredoxin subunit